MSTVKDELEGTVMGGAGFLPDGQWLYRAIERYRSITGQAPSVLRMSPSVDKALSKALGIPSSYLSLPDRKPHSVTDPFWLDVIAVLEIDIDPSKCCPDKWGDVSSWLEGVAGRLEMRSSACLEEISIAIN